MGTGGWITGSHGTCDVAGEATPGKPMELTEQEHAVLAAIDGHREEAIGFLRTWIRTPSPTGREGEQQRLVRQQLEAMGLEVEAFVADLRTLKAHPEFIAAEAGGQPLSERPNIIGKRRGAGGGPSVLIFGHVDTVPPGPRAEWLHDPFGAEIQNKRMYGRGAADMKSGLAAAFLAVDLLKRLGVRLKGDVVCMTNIEEEVGGSAGILACIVEGGIRAEVALYPHPGADRPCIVATGSSGAVACRIRVKGETVHGMDAHLGVNAIEKALRVFATLKALDEERGRTVRNDLTERGYALSGRLPRATNLYLSALRGGDWIYQVPPTCEMDWMFTFPPQESVDEARALIEDAVRRACEADPWLRKHPATLEWLPITFTASRPFPDHPFITLAGGAIHDVFGRPAELMSVPVGSDIRVTVNYGRMPSAIFGPLGDRMHAPDEWVDLESYIGTIKATALVLMRWCGTV